MNLSRLKYQTALSLTAIALSAAPALAQEAPAKSADYVRSVSVSGVCQRSIVPDKSSLNMVAEATNPRDLKAAVNEAVKIYESAKTQITKLKLKDLELTTSEYSINPQYDWKDNKQVFRGYQARIGLRAETSDIDRMGEVMAIAASANMKDVGAWSLVVSPAKYKQVQQECLAEAALDARSNAEKMSAGLGVKVGPVISLSQNGAVQPPMPMPMARMLKADMAAAESVASPSIEAGKQDISVTVQASFLLQ